MLSHLRTNYEAARKHRARVWDDSRPASVATVKLLAVLLYRLSQV